MRLVRGGPLLGSPSSRQLFTRGYEGYSVPVQVDEATLRYMIDSWDIDLARSRVARRRRRSGLCNLAVRGDRGWIGGIGVVPEAAAEGRRVVH